MVIVAGVQTFIVRIVTATAEEPLRGVIQPVGGDEHTFQDDQQLIELIRRREPVSAGGGES